MRVWIKIVKSKVEHVLDKEIIGPRQGPTWIVISKAKHKLQEAYLAKFLMFFEWKFLSEKKMIII